MILVFVGVIQMLPEKDKFYILYKDEKIVILNDKKPGHGIILYFDSKNKPIMVPFRLANLDTKKYLNSKKHNGGIENALQS